MDYNPYLLNPLYVAQITPGSGKNVKVVFFLGSAPKAVIAAARQYTMNPGLSWPAAAEKTLKDFYGAKWRMLLTPENPQLHTNSMQSTFYRLNTDIRFYGGEEDYEDDEIIENNEYANNGRENKNDETERSEHDNEHDNKPLFKLNTNLFKVKKSIDTHEEGYNIDKTALTIIYSDISVYPEDTIYDLKCKVQMATNIAVFRQHLFYYINDEGPNIPYNLLLDSVPLPVYWGMSNNGRAIMKGVYIDETLESRRDNISVVALDSFICLSKLSSIRINKVYIVDLYSIVPPLNSYERPNDGLDSILRDSYQFNMFYYGWLIHYWPHLSPNAANLALTNPEMIMEQYPLLYPKPETQLELQKSLSDLSFTWKPTTQLVRENIAVTKITVKISPVSVGMRVNIRNVFDFIATEIDMPAARLQFAYSESDMIVAREQTVVLKRHLSGYGPRVAQPIDGFLRVWKPNTVSFALIRDRDESFIKKPSATGGLLSFVFFTLYADLHIEASSEWREDARISFDMATEAITKCITPLINKINAMKAIAFPIGGSLVNKSTDLGGITVSAFWPNSLTSSDFASLKTEIKEYDRAGIIFIRGLQQANAFLFNFRKGITAYSHEMMNYNYMTDNDVLQRWNNIFFGRFVRIFHRTTDLRMEVSEVDSLDEFYIIQRYLFSFFERFKKHLGAQPTKKVEELSSVLRKLQERDPDLFDLKKYDQNATVYSVLCQSGRQPQLYSEDELQKLPAKQRQRMTKYWNYTEKAPAYYDCPNAKFPHLSFRMGEHPKGYCLPCCKKTLPTKDSRAALVNQKCLGSKVDDEDISQLLSRHILAYGKEIAIGRISDLSKIIDSLFFDAIGAPFKLHCIGVTQSTASIPEAGFAYSVAYIAGDADMSPEETITELAELARSMKDTFYALGDGGGALFASAADLAEEFLNAFVRQETKLGMLSPGGIDKEIWQLILLDLVRIAYKIEIVVIEDPENITPEFIITKTAMDAILDKRTDIGIIVHNLAGFYPVAALDPKSYTRTSQDHQWMVARKVFEFNPPEAVPDNICKIIYDMIGANTQTNSKNLNLTFIERWIKKTKFNIESRLINISNMAYGVLIKDSDNYAYIPIMDSPYPKTGENLFGARPKLNMPIAFLNTIIDSINAFEPNIVVPTHQLEYENKRIGFATQSLLYFFHNPEEPNNLPKINIPYDIHEIDYAIIKRESESNNIDGLISVKNRLYRLFLAEFSICLRNERDMQMRKKLRGFISDTDFSNSEKVNTLRGNLISLLEIEDLQKIRIIISKAFTISAKSVSDIILQMIDETVFNFDRKTMNELLNDDHEAAKAKLRELMKNQIVVGDISKKQLTNIFTSCLDSDNGICEDKKLIIPKEYIDDMYDILASDVRNPSKTTILTAVSAGVFDPMDFIKRPCEHLIFN